MGTRLYQKVVWRHRPFARSGDMTDTAICEPVTEECNGGGVTHVGMQAPTPIYVTLVAVESEQQEELRHVLHPLSGKAASYVHSQFACFFVQS